MSFQGFLNNYLSSTRKIFLSSRCYHSNREEKTRNMLSKDQVRETIAIRNKKETATKK